MMMSALNSGKIELSYTILYGILYHNGNFMDDTSYE
jgi:hypothetical protein